MLVEEAEGRCHEGADRGEPHDTERDAHDGVQNGQVAAQDRLGRQVAVTCQHHSAC